MSDEASPRPWRLESDNLTLNPHIWFIVNANGAKVTGGFFLEADARLIVDAVNNIDRLRDELDVERSQHATDIEQVEYHEEHHRKSLEAERDRLRNELTRETQNYEDVVAFHKRTEEYLRGLIKRLITVREKVFWRKDEKTGMMYETCLIDEDEARKTIEEAKAAIKEDGK